MWIKFLQDYNYWMKMSTRPFKKDAVVFATRDLAETALRLGVAEKTARPKDATKDDEPETQAG